MLFFLGEDSPKNYSLLMTHGYFVKARSALAKRYVDSCGGYFGTPVEVSFFSPKTLQSPASPLVIVVGWDCVCPKVKA